jgi:restriction system protein
MAPNSLFAILLRSSWWVSLLPAAAIGLAARALLPDPYVIYGLMGAIPFLVIAVVAARRQWSLPGTAESTRVLEQLSAMSWREFSTVLQAAYGKAGFQVSALDGQGAADLLLQRDGRSTLIACRRWKAGNLGAEPLRQLASARRERDASRCVFVSLQAPAEATQRAARQESVELLHGIALVALVRSAMPAARG